MKKLLSSLLVFALMLSMVSAISLAAEDDLPFELVPPANVSAKWLEENDSPTTTAIAYSLSNEMTDFFKKLENAHVEDRFDEFISGYGFDDINMTTQVDWAVDDVNDSVSGWHCNEFWNADYGFGYDEDYQIRVGEWDGVDLWIGNATDTVNEHWVTRYVSEEALNGNPETKTPGLKDQMRPEQYEYRYNSDGDGSLWIDYSEHTVYFRMRFVVTTYKDTDEGTQNKYYYSEWSNVAAVGKDAEQYEPLTAQDLPAPEITGLRKTDKEFNGCPVVAFTLTVPEELAANNAKVTANGGGIVIDTYARVKGDTEWTLMSNTDWIISAGERECALIHLLNDERPNIPEDTVIELRCRYRCSQPDMDDIYSEYSKIISFGTDDISQGGSQGENSTGDIDPSNLDPNTCPICHFCSQPLGLCIFIWLLILIVLIVIVIIIIVVSKKKVKDKRK